ncbi:MAG: hypothetical protein ACE5I1_02205 [bacterium]
MTRIIKICSLLFIFGLLFLAATGSLWATKLVHRNVAELTTLADRIFIGACLSVETKSMTIEGQNAIVTEYTFEVTQAIKGVAGKSIVFRQFGPSQGAGSIVGMPVYEIGKSYMLFLRKDSPYKLTSPIGFGQGAFLVFANSNGALQAVNAFGNGGLFKEKNNNAPVLRKPSMNLTEQKLLQRKAGPVDIESLVSLVKKLTE